MTENTDQVIGKMEVKSWLQDEFLPKSIVTIDGKQNVMQKTTSELNVSEFTDFLRDIEAWCAYRRIPLEQDDYYNMAMGK